MSVALDWVNEGIGRWGLDVTLQGNGSSDLISTMGEAIEIL